ncbi:MAG: M23 family metallopeptidase [Candidatus Heimdallarchaeota archaeon]|nr:M23 family metallopeptidase [Candidatus Heimdallarchaeota archaeon]MCK4955421.1 M23 family metallopeptidase [Candidatus Heimdallarchaeota archaeon]
MEISYLPSEYLINCVRKLEDIKRLESNFFLRAVRIRNDSENTIRLIQYKFDIKRSNTCVKSIIYNEKMIKEKSEDVDEIFERLVHPDISKLFMGVEEFWKKELFSSNTLEPNHETGFRLEHFTHVDLEPLDQLILTVTYIEEEEEKKKVCKIPLVQYKNKNQYIFPLKGAWIAINAFENPYEHRRMHSQEFSFDLGQLDENMFFIPPKGNKNEFFCFYGKEVLAIADGEVVDAFDGIPENPSAGELLPEEKMGEIINQYGYKPLAGGNFVVVKHSGNENSFYAHLIPESIKVKKGDKVKQGQVLGLLGNSGNSSAPHLHFQLMQGPDILTSRGLPCYFTNITEIEGNKIELIDKSFSVIYVD